jgi:Fe-S cluster assembly protein SufD
MSQIADKADIQATLMANLKAFESQLNGQTNSLQEGRKAGLASFEKLGLPQAKSEEYKYTNLTKLLNKKFADHKLAPAAQLSAEQLEEILFKGFEANVLVFVNGQYAKDLSKIISPESELIIRELSEAADEFKEDFEKHFAKHADLNDEFTALNTAFAQHGAFIKVPAGKVVEAPVALYFINDSSKEKVVTYPRNLFIVGQSAQVNVIETYRTIGEQDTFTNIVTEIAMDKNSGMNFHKIQTDSENANFAGNTQVYQLRDSLFNAITITLSGGMTRNNLNIALDDENCEAHMYGLYLLNDKQHVDNHTAVDHRKPNSFSNELYKGVMDGKSTAVFNGKIFVRQDAQKTNAFQSNNNILISDDAAIYTKPQLEIWADDVKCTHGCTTGQLDEEQLFYLQARGIDKESARAMLLYAFAKDVLENIKIEPLKEALDAVLEERLKF